LSILRHCFLPSQRPTDPSPKHEKLSEKKLAKKQLATIQRILPTIDTCTDRMCNRLSEDLRRKNEVLKNACTNAQSVTPRPPTT